MDSQINRLKKRADFVNVGKGKRFNTVLFNLQAKQNNEIYDTQRVEDGFPRLGFTVTKKAGNAVKRNRIRRRLKSAIQIISPRLFLNGNVKPYYDYVLVGKDTILTADFMTLKNQLLTAFEGVHRARSSAKATVNS